MPVQSPVKTQSFTPQTPHTPPMETNGSPPKTIFDTIPLGLVLSLAKPYLAGQSSEAAIDIAHKIFAHDAYASTIDILGEDAVSDQDCEETVTAYHRLIEAVSARQIASENPRQQMTISMKPSMFSTMAPQHGKQSDVAQEKAFDRITRVADYALKKKVEMTLEAEDHRWTNFHLEAYFALISAGYTNLGTVLQTRLLRTEKDVVRFDERMRVRLVIGIYNEPAQIAHTDKKMMKDLVVQFAAQLLDAGTYVELATHDVKCIEHFYRYTAAPNKIPAGRFEHQFLLGVPRAKVQKGLVSGKYFADLAKSMPPGDAEYMESLVQTGAVVRMYLPYGTAKVSGAYCRRRLRENPNMITYGIKNVLGIQ